MSNNNDNLVIFEDINEKYAGANYGPFKLIMMKDNGYVNVTKMCEEDGKKFSNWKQNSQSKEISKAVAKHISRDGIPSDEKDLFVVVSGGNQHEAYLRGTYAHPKLVLHIACWVSSDFYIKASEIVNEYYNKQMREKLEELHRKEINKLESEKSELQIIREKLEKEFERADEERKRADEERKRAELRYIDMCKKYDIQYDNIVELKEDIGLLNDNVNILKEDANIILSNQNDLMESSKTQIDMLDYMIEENNELKDEMNNVKEKITDVQVKLGISVEDRVPKTEKKSKSETFILLEKEEYVVRGGEHLVGENEDEYQYQAVCGQIGYSNSKAKKLIREENYKEILKIEYTPNTKNLLNRLKEQKLKITFQYNKFNTDIARETLIDYIRKIDCDKRNI